MLLREVIFGITKFHVIVFAAKTQQRTFCRAVQCMFEQSRRMFPLDTRDMKEFATLGEQSLSLILVIPAIAVLLVILIIVFPF